MDCRAPFLNSGTTSASLAVDGKTPVLMAVLKSVTIFGTKTSAISLITLAGIDPIGADLDSSRLLTSLKTSSKLVGRKENVSLWG